MENMQSEVKALPAPVEKPVNPDKMRHGPVPEKEFLGRVFKGRDWRIEWDDQGYERCLVTFKKKPPVEIRKIVKEMGWYWSPALNAWSRKLTWKSWRAGLKLAQILSAEMSMMR